MKKDWLSIYCLFSTTTLSLFTYTKTLQQRYRNTKHCVILKK
jgi:hypothetical protein